MEQIEVDFLNMEYSQRLRKLAKAIKEYEGWYKGSRSYRNRNPGNLRYSPFQSKRRNNFAVFPDLATGKEALWYDLHCKCTGNTHTGLNKNSTLQDLVNVYAPEEDGNNPKTYATFLSGKLGISRDTVLSYFSGEEEKVEEEKEEEKKKGLNIDTSIVDFLKYKGKESSFKARTRLYEERFNDIYRGTADQNIKLLEQLKGEGF